MVKYVSENFSVCENTNIKYYIYSPTYFSPSLRRFRNCILVEVFRRHTLCTICSPTSSINLWTAKQTCGLLPKVCWVLRVTVIPLKVHFSLQDDGVCQTIHLFFSIYLVYFSCIQMKHFFGSTQENRLKQDQRVNSCYFCLKDGLHLWHKRLKVMIRKLWIITHESAMIGMSSIWELWV